jgi:hypothetical protein
MRGEEVVVFSGPRGAQPGRLPHDYYHAKIVCSGLSEMTVDELRQAALDSDAFSFWKGPDEDRYSLSDGQPL